MSSYSWIFTAMARDFGTIKAGKEKPHEGLLMPLENNALFVYRSHPECDNRAMTESIALALFTLRTRITGTEMPEAEELRHGVNILLSEAMLQAFDPFVNEEIGYELENQGVDWKAPSFCRTYYRKPIRCLLRIKGSVEEWEKRAGPRGYFTNLSRMTKGRMGSSPMYSVPEVTRL